MAAKGRVLLVFVVMAVLFLCGCNAINDNYLNGNGLSGNDGFDDPRAGGRIFVVSGGAEHEPYCRRVHRDGRTNDGMYFSASVIPRSVEEIVEELEVIRLEDDFRLEIEGAGAQNVTYALFDLEFNELSRRSFEGGVSVPNEEGVYILDVSVRWTAGSESWYYSHVFKVEVS